MRTLALAVLFASMPTAAYAGSQADAQDFATEAKLIYREVACAGEDPVDAKVQKAVDRHCKKLGEEVASYQKKFVEPATAFFAKVRPSGLPTTVVYPFGGGDLLTALVTYPDATEITTLSLEHAGDPTRLAGATAKQLKKAFGLYEDVIHGLLVNSDFESDKLKLIERGPVPGQLGFHLLGAAMMGYLPTHLRFFKIEDDGTIDYYTAADVQALSKTKAKRKKGSWLDTDFSEAFSNMELELSNGTHTVTFRHISANLDDPHFKGSGIEKHLQAKGKVSMMTKAASYLLWMNAFSEIQDYIAKNLVWMPSDSTGLPPAVAKANGLEQETYGSFAGAMFKVSRSDQDAFIKLWKKQPKRKLGFRYGYRDSASHAHMVITKAATP